MPFQKGHKFAKGGPRPNSGRPPNWQKELADKLIHDKKLLPRLAKMAAGEEIIEKPVVAINGTTVKVKQSADAGTQVYAFEKLADRAWGKAPQAVKVEGELSVNLSDAVRKAREKRGLPSKPQ